MATVNRGHTFAADGEVTNINLHNMVDNASVSDIRQTDIGANHGLMVTSVTAPAQSSLWRDASDGYGIKVYEPISGDWKEQADSDDLADISGSIAAVSGAVGALESTLNNIYFLDHKDISLSFTDTTVTLNGDYIFVAGYRIDLSGGITGTMPADLDTGSAGEKWYSIIAAVKDGGAEPKIVFSETKESINLPADYIGQRHVGYVYRNNTNVFEKAYDAFTSEINAELSANINSLFSAGATSAVDLSSYIPPSAVSVKFRYSFSVNATGQIFYLLNPDGSPGYVASVKVANVAHDESGKIGVSGSSLRYQISHAGTFIPYFHIIGFSQNTAKQAY